MRDIPQSVPDQPVSLLSMGTRMVQLGYDQIEAVLALQAKRIERERAVAHRVCDALMHARTYDAGAFAQAWQTMTREYLAASVALWEQGMVCAARNQTAYGALLRDVVLNADKAWLRATPGQMTQQAGTVPQAGGLDDVPWPVHGRPPGRRGHAREAGTPCRIRRRLKV